MSELFVRPATVRDVPAIEALVAPLAAQKILIAKESVAYYEGIQEFLVVETANDAGEAEVVACGALHVMWRDIAEVRTLAANSNYRGRGGWAGCLLSPF